MEYNGAPFSGIAVEYTSNQKLLAEVSYVNGQKNGRAIEWTESGGILRDQNFRFDSLDGISREWFEDGTLRSESEYELGICKRKKEWEATGAVVMDFQLKESDPQFKTLLHLRNAYGKRRTAGTDDTGG